MNQRTGKKGRRSDRNSTPRLAKVPVRNELSYLLPQRAEGVYCNPPLAHTLATLIGCVVEVQMKNGEVYEGVLRAISPNMEISLNVAHIKGEPPTRENVYDRKEVKFADVVTISAKTGSNPQLALFKTDTEISGRTNGPNSRELQPFTDFSEDQTELTLGNSTDSGWSVEDMWAVNQNKFKVSSTFDEELTQYTTPLSRDGEGYKQRELEAIQKASEIETKTTFSRHGVDDVGTEEDRWSAVVREPAVSNVAARPQCSLSGPGLGVKENGSHVLTPSDLSSSSAPTQAPAPTSTSPLLAPATSTTMSSPAVPPLPSHSESSSGTLTTPPSQPPPPGNNQSSISNDVITDSSAATAEDKTNEGVDPAIKLSNGAEKLQQASVGESATSEKECNISVGEAQTALEDSALQLSRSEAEKGQGEAEEKYKELQAGSNRQGICNPPLFHPFLFLLLLLLLIISILVFCGSGLSFPILNWVSIEHPSHPPSHQHTHSTRQLPLQQCWPQPSPTATHPNKRLYPSLCLPQPRVHATDIGVVRLHINPATSYTVQTQRTAARILAVRGAQWYGGDDYPGCPAQPTDSCQSSCSDVSSGSRSKQWRAAAVCYHGDHCTTTSVYCAAHSTNHHTSGCHISS